MSLKDKIRRYINPTGSSFFVSLFRSLFFVLFAINILKLKVPFLSFSVSIWIEIILGAFLFLAWLRSKNNLARTLISEFSLGLFSVCTLLVFAINVINLINQFTINQYSYYLVITAIISGFIFFDTNRREFRSRIESLEETEQKPEAIATAWSLLKLSITNIFNKRDLGHGIVLVLIIALAGFFYISGNGNFGFQGDEYYHAKVTKGFFEDKKLFEISDGLFYKRSEITSLLPIVAKFAFTLIRVDASDEFIYRLPVALISLGSVLLIYLISRKLFRKNHALVITAIFAAEVWFIYFAKFLRFYSPTLFFELLILYALLLSDRLKTKHICLLACIPLYFFLQSYFIVLAGYIIILILWDKFKNKKYYQLLPIILVSLAFVSWQLFQTANNASLIYDETSLKFNLKNIFLQVSWLLQNYGVYVILFLSPITVFWKNKLYQYTILSIVFFLLYINSAEFNFTFRPIYFFLPLVFIFSIATILISIKNKLVKIITVSVLLGVSLYQAVQYRIDKAEDCFFPTRLIYEKSPCISSEKELFHFVGEYATKNNIGLNNVYFLGLGPSEYYSDIEKSNVLSYANKSGGLANLQEILSRRTNEHLIFIANQNAFPRDNRLQEIFFHRNYISEVSLSLTDYLENKTQATIIFETPKKYSKVYLIKPVDQTDREDSLK